MPMSQMSQLQPRDSVSANTVDHNRSQTRMVPSCVWNGASDFTADSVHVTLRLFGHGARDTRTQMGHGRAPVATDVTVAAERLGLRALVHSTPRFDVRELFLLGHGETDSHA